MKLFAILDSKTGKFGMPFAMETEESAKRQFLSSLAEVRVPTLISQFPDDYTLYALGDFDYTTGEIIGKVEFIANAAYFGADLPKMIKANKAICYSIEQIDKRCKSYVDKMIADGHEKARSFLVKKGLLEEE